MSWFKKFWDSHGERFVYGIIAVCFATGFLYSDIKALQDTGVVIFTGVAMVCFNKIRGGSPPKE